MELNKGRRWREVAFGIPHRLRLNEAAPLITLSVVGLLGFGFIELADEVGQGSTQALDARLLLSLRNPADLTDPIGPGWLQESARDITALGGHVVLSLITLATAAYLIMTRRGGVALLVAASVGGGMIVSTLLKLGYERPRPDLVPHAAKVYTASFPSGHAMLSAVVFLTLGALLARVHKPRRVKLFFLGLAVALTILVGASRVYLGVHWPSDVLAGWCVGAAWAGLCWYAALILQRRGQIETEAPPPDPQSPDALSRVGDLGTAPRSTNAIGQPK